MDELKTTPNEPTASAPTLAAKALDQELNAGPLGSSGPAPVNDLTSMVVKRKRKAPDTNGAGGKRKADDDAGDMSEKKAKLEEAPASS